MGASGLEPRWLPSLSVPARASLAGGEPNPFENDCRLRFREKDRHVAYLDPAGKPVAAVGLTSAEVDVNGVAFTVVGVGGVIVRPDQRGRGLAAGLVTVALEAAADWGHPFALLFCLRSREGLYARLGFAPVAEAVSVEQPGGARATMHMVTMWRALRASAVWPPGPVTLRGLPF